MPNKTSTLLERLTPDRIKQARVRKAYVDLFNSPDGKLVLNDLASRHGVLRTSMFAARNSDDGIARAISMAFAEGERNVVLGIIGAMNLDFDEYLRKTSEEAENV